MNANLEGLEIKISTKELENAMLQATQIVKESISEISIILSNMDVGKSNFESLTSNFSNITSSIIGFNSISHIMSNSANSIISAIGGMAGPIGIATLAITGIIGVISLLSNYQSEETKKHNETMEAMNKEIGARNELRSKQEEQLQGNLSEIANLESLNNELKNITKANGEVKAGYEDRAAFIVSMLNKALGEQITIEDGVVKGYEKSSTSINDKIAKLKAEAILEAQLPAYKKALIESTNAQIKADQMQMELSDLKMEKDAKLKKSLFKLCAYFNSVFENCIYNKVLRGC